METNNNSVLNTLLTSGFLPGFISTLTFHQIALTVFWSLGLVGFAPYSLDATQPFGIPAVLSLAFWGGIWGIFYRLAANQFPSIKAYWLILMATLLPTIAFIAVVAPIKGIPFSIFTVQLITVAVFINLAWALGTAFLSQRLTKSNPVKFAHS